MFEWLSKRPAVALAAAVVVLIVATFLVARTINPPTERPTNWAQVWCYDLSAKKLFVGSEANAPPFAITGGAGTAVRAEVFSCGSCDDPTQRFAGWLWKFTDTARDAVQQGIDATPEGFVESSPYDLPAARADPNATLMASADRPNEWFAEPSEEAQQIRADLAQRCGGKAPTPCAPKPESK